MECACVHGLFGGDIMHGCTTPGSTTGARKCMVVYM